MNARRLLLPALLAAMLGGCSTDLASLNPLGGGGSSDPLRASEYNYFYRRDQTGTPGVVTAADLIGPDGRCAFEQAPRSAVTPDAVVAQSPASAPISPRSNQALYFTAGPEAGGTGSAAPNALPPQVRSGPSGIALQMTECQVVQVAGYTDRVEISTNERGQRAVTLTYLSGDRPGIYRFNGGRLAAMERVAEPLQQKKQQKPAKAAKKTAPPQ